MSLQRWEPDVVVGIDFGMTCTGVAWSAGPDWPDPKTIQRWPGRLSHELRNKVDTCVAYKKDTRDLASWGFLCNPNDDKYEFNELFKLFLDPDYEDNIAARPSLHDAQTWFKDYLACLHKYINRHFSESMPRFEQKRTEYVFSVPTTWKDPAMIAEMEKIIKAAGFGASSRERASIYLTEAEAAAVYTSKQSLEVGDVFLVCDIGGGTTDLNVLKVKSAAAEAMELVPLSWAEGQAVGSTIIDFKIQELIQERLARVRPHLKDDLEILAAKMTQEDFLRFKCSMGSDHNDGADLHLLVPGLAPGYNSVDAGIHDSKLVLTLQDLKSTFDDQIDTLFGLIDNQLQIVQSRSPKDSMSFLVLSGGLSNSAYVQKRIRDRYEHGAGCNFKNAKNMRFLIASEPQLAVVHGLVTARVQVCKGGRQYLTKRCSPVSYGIVSRQLYDPDKHQGQNWVRDEYDQRRRWAVDQITWIVKRGEVLDFEKGASQMYQMRLALGEETLPWRTRIAMSTQDADKLPLSIQETTARVICEVEFELNAKDFKMKNRHWYQLKQPYYTGQFEVRLLLGAALQFQVWSKDRLLSKEHEEIKVEWVPAGALPTALSANDASRMYQVAE